MVVVVFKDQDHDLTFEYFGGAFLKIAVNISSQSLTLFDYVTFMVLEIFSLLAQLFKTKARLF